MSENSFGEIFDGVAENHDKMKKGHHQLKSEL